jgi:predicted RNA-binding protein
MTSIAHSYWVLTGDRENWRRGITDRIWGVVPKLKSSWESLQREDFLFFYAKAPTSAIFGTGIVRDKFLQDRPLWPDEIRERKVLYPFRFTFDILAFIDEERWASEGVRPGASIPCRAGMNRIANPENIKVLLAETEGAFAVNAPLATAKETRLSLHDEIKEKLRKIGQLQNYLSETECKLNGERLDVAWRRVAASVPQKVFEVQVSGNLYAAVAKLKKAHVLWNSQPFLVLQKDERAKANDLLAGPFHEIGQSVLIRDVEAVDDLYTRITKADEIRRQFGL